MIRQRSISILICFLAVFSFPVITNAQVISSLQITDETGWNSSYPGVSFSLNFYPQTASSNDWMDPSKGFALFENTILDSYSTGQTLVATSQSDSDFNSVVSLLTNGIDNRFSLHFVPLFLNGASASTSTFESTFQYGSPHLTNVDFVGYDINSISLTINSFDIYDDTAGNTWYDFDGTLAVQGVPAVVPEPISSILFITGGTLLAGRRFFKKKKTEQV